MIPDAIGLVVGAGAMGWAALLALGGEAPGLTSTVGDPPPDTRARMPVSRALRLARMALLTIGAASVGFAAAWWTRSAGGGAVLVGITWVLLLLVGDILPRALGLLAPRMASRVLPWARASLWPFRPLLGIIGWMDKLAHRVVPPATAQAGGHIGAAQRDMLLGVFSLEDTAIEDVMTPRLDIVGVSVEAPWTELLDVVRQSEHSRIPVFHDTLDDIAGVIYAKDVAPVMIGASAPPEQWQELVRPVPFVPESKSLAAQLRDFQRGAGHLAIVVDEFGGTSGLVTLEDVLEEIVGEIHDEYDVNEEPEIEREGNDRFWVNGRVTLDDLSATLGISFIREEVSTVGGLIYAELGRVPRPGEELRVAGFRLVVEQVVRRRVHRVYFERLEPAPASAVDESPAEELA
ncbi:MAG: hemolysin family protein [Gemmatimonadota bacterium]|nr:hemolysin family protein [Gemmatimonadota bacterium]MDH4349657.1 hemolysin family protein [Gemmatimonadota bacterium]